MLVPLQNAVLETSQVGGKAANLSWLIVQGYRVPAGYALPVEAYQSHFERFAPQVHRLLDARPSGLESAQQLCQAVQRAFHMLPLDKGLLAHLHNLPLEGSFAVRSSATAEDGAEHAFAGLGDSVLNVGTYEGLVNAVRKVWASAWSTRSFLYREQHRIDHLGFGMGVVIQEMLHPERAGTLFTRNPVDGTGLYAEYVEGLGEALVSGTATGQVVNWNSKEQWVADLLRAGAVIEFQREAPQDIEWAVEAGQLYILQTRPITTQRETPQKVPTGLAELAKGLGASGGIASGYARVVTNDFLHLVEEGDILVTSMTTPDMMPALLKAAGVVTEIGGITCHAAITCRELGKPAVVGVGSNIGKIGAGQHVTIDGWEGKVYAVATAPAPAIPSASKQIEEGSTVKVIRQSYGMNAPPKGTVGVVFWKGHTQWGERIGILDGYSKYFCPLSYVVLVEN